MGRGRVGIVSRVLAALLGILVLWVLVLWWTEPADAELLSGPPLVTPLFMAWFVLVCLSTAVTGRADGGPAVAILERAGEFLHAWRRARRKPATVAQRDRLRQLGEQVPRFLMAGDAVRRISELEMNLPPTPAQQLELARRGERPDSFTRDTAKRFLARCCAQDEWAVLEAWCDGWEEAGVTFVGDSIPSRAERAAFDAAAAALFRAGIPYPLPAELPGRAIVSETARMQLAPELPGWLDAAQRTMVADGVLRRGLTPAEIMAFLPGVVELWRRAPEFDHGQALAFLVARDRPALLTHPWDARALVRETEEYLEAVSPEEQSGD